MAADFVNGLSRAQKVALTTGADFWSTADVAPAGPGALRMADGPHGLRVQDDDNPDHLGLGRSEPATCFPPAVTLASSWDRDLVRAVGQALGREARAAGVAMVLGPGMNIKRSPLCGRNFEYFSEDPLLSAVIAAAYVEGLQSTGVAACVKHFAANNQETDRQRVSADVDVRALHEIYLRGFRRVIATAQPWAVMSSYNRINGVFASENSWLLTGILRDHWGFDGVVVSDWGAVHDPVEALQAGLDVRMPGRPDDPRVADALAAGALEEAVLDRTARRIGLLADRTRRAGPTGPVDLDAHDELTRRAAAESAVLLKNDDAILPLDATRSGSIAVLGELATEPRYQGSGSSAVNARRVVSGAEGFRRRFGGHIAVRFAAGYTLGGGPGAEDLRRVAVDLAAEVDTVVLFLGLPTESEAEGRDRVDIDLPPDQVALLRAVAGVNRRVVVVLVNGSVVTTAPWRECAAAILEVWLTGQAHGDSVADVLTGTVNPSGKLAETVPIRLRDTPSYLDFPGENGHVRYGEGIFVGYRYYDARDVDVDYPFGHGLSYTTFEYTDLVVAERDLDDPVALTVSVTLTNTGDRTGAEVVQVYVGDRSRAALAPVRELRAFEKVSLRPGESRRVLLAVRRDDLMRFDTGVGNWVDAGGRAVVEVGSSSRDIRLTRETLIAATPVLRPLTIWSTLRDWQNDVDAGPRLQQLLESRGGVRGRMADLLGSDTGHDSVLSNPLVSLLEFPGFPVTQDDIPGLLIGHGAGAPRPDPS